MPSAAAGASWHPAPSGFAPGGVIARKSPVARADDAGEGTAPEIAPPAGGSVMASTDPPVPDRSINDPTIDRPGLTTDPIDFDRIESATAHIRLREPAAASTPDEQPLPRAA